MYIKTKKLLKYKLIKKQKEKKLLTEAKLGVKDILKTKIKKNLENE